ncbi:DUF188 domain-containing protein [Alteribacillus sp. YIM 98480]|uniref:DUF188 domain-containing protein n=1 Tax=Alteribacillus sp. YIM 98480 TaxID=2606599 RepID=UPI0021056D0E|nr:DUF188 domain-containing protein [Alteribacillus sp. YIM 98480]
MDTLAKTYQMESYFVFTFAHVTTTNYYSQTVTLDAEPEAVDIYILNHIYSNDVVITQDNGLAAVVLQKGANALSPRGHLYNNGEIDYLLMNRYEGIQMKRGKTKPKSTPSFKNEDKKRFVCALEKLLTKTRD